VKQLRMLSANVVATCFVIDLPDPGAAWRSQGAAAHAYRFCRALTGTDAERLQRPTIGGMSIQSGRGISKSVVQPFREPSVGSGHNWLPQPRHAEMRS
jgi:hypothetical protein